MHEATKEAARPTAAILGRSAGQPQPHTRRPAADYDPAMSRTPAFDEEAEKPTRMAFNVGPWRVGVSVTILVAGTLGLALWGLLVALVWWIF